MAEVNLTINGLSSAGAAPAVQTGVEIGTTDQYFIPASRDIMLRVENGSGGVDITFVTAGTADGLAIADRTVTIAANTTRVFGNLNPKVYGNEGRVEITFSAADANITMEAYRL